MAGKFTNFVRNFFIMIQDIAPLHFDNTYRDIHPVEDSIILSFSDNKVLSTINVDKIRLPQTKELFETGNVPATIYLFSIDKTAYFLTENTLPVADGYQYYSISEARELKPKHTVFAILTAYSLYTWYTTRSYCGKCGVRMQHHHRERMRECPQCHTMEYPKISPAVIMAIWDGDKLLLSRYSDRAYTRYALLAGFAETGETIEQTVHRETMEEVGLRVKNLRYYKSQPWGMSSSLLFGFFAQLDGSPDITLDETELSEAAWFARAEIPPTAVKDFSLTNEMIDYFREHPEEFR